MTTTNNTVIQNALTRMMETDKAVWAVADGSMTVSEAHQELSKRYPQTTPEHIAYRAYLWKQMTQPKSLGDPIRTIPVPYNPELHASFMVTQHQEKVIKDVAEGLMSIPEASEKLCDEIGDAPSKATGFDTWQDLLEWRVNLYNSNINS